MIASACSVATHLTFITTRWAPCQILGTAREDMGLPSVLLLQSAFQTSPRGPPEIKQTIPRSSQGFVSTSVSEGSHRVRRTYSDTHLHLIQSEGLSGKTLPQPFLPQPFLPPHPHCRAAHTEKADEALRRRPWPRPAARSGQATQEHCSASMLLLMTTSLPKSQNL